MRRDLFIVFVRYARRAVVEICIVKVRRHKYLTTSSLQGRLNFLISMWLKKT